MRVQRNEVAQLTVNDPADGPISVLALDSKHRFLTVQGVQAVRYADAEAVEQSRNATVILLVALKPHSEHESRKASSDELVGDINSLGGHG